MICSLGIDTSNYTTSAALFDLERFEIAASERRLLEVGDGMTGLRQSEALFQHTRALPELVGRLFGSVKEQKDVKCVAVSDRPSEQEGSYMPCFLAGVSAAETAAASLGVPCFRFSHQAGHIAAALFSSGGMALVEQTFLAFHISGGTTQALFVEPDDRDIFRIRCVGGSSDLKAGQAVDRIGAMLGIGFPAGAELERLAHRSEKRFEPRISANGALFSLSGLENLASRMLGDGEKPENIARFALDYISACIISCCDALFREYGTLPLVFAGGVMSDGIIRSAISKRFEAVYAAPSLSSDNAVGTALLGALRLSRG